MPDDLEVVHLLLTAERIYKEAKNHSAHAVYEESLVQYYGLVKLAIKMLKMVFASHSVNLDPRIRVLTLYQLASIYYEETENYSEALLLISQAHGLAERHNIIRLEIVCLVLLVKVGYKIHPTWAEVRLNNAIRKHALNAEVTAMLRILKLQVLGKVDFRYEATKSLDQSHEIWRLQNLFIVHTLLTKYDAKPSFETPNELTNDPLSLWYDFCSVYSLLLLGDMPMFKEAANRLDKQMAIRNKNKWKDWASNGAQKFTMHLPNETVDFSIFWLNPSEIKLFRLLLMGYALSKNGGYSVVQRLVQKGNSKISDSLKDGSYLTYAYSGSLNQLSASIQHIKELSFHFQFLLEWLEIFSTNNEVQINIQDPTGGKFKSKIQYLHALNHIKKSTPSSLNQAQKILLDIFEAPLKTDVWMYSCIQLLALCGWLQRIGEPVGDLIGMLVEVISDAVETDQTAVFPSAPNSSGSSFGDFIRYDKNAQDIVLILLLNYARLSAENYASYETQLRVNYNEYVTISRVLSILSRNGYGQCTVHDVDVAIKCTDLLPPTNFNDSARIYVRRIKQLLLKRQGGTSTELEDVKLQIIRLERNMVQAPPGYVT